MPKNQWNEGVGYSQTRNQQRARRAAHVSSTDFHKSQAKRHDYNMQLIQNNAIKAKKPTMRKTAGLYELYKEAKDRCWKGYKPVKGKKPYSDGSCEPVEKKAAKSPAWQRSEGKDPAGGLNAAGVASYRKHNPGSKLQMAVTKDPSKIKAGSDDEKRRKSFCARMSGMRKRQKPENNTGNDRLSLSLKKWNC